MSDGEILFWGTGGLGEVIFHSKIEEYPVIFASKKKSIIFALSFHELFE